MSGQRHDVSIDSAFLADDACIASCLCGWQVDGLSDAEATRAALEHQP